LADHATQAGLAHHFEDHEQQHEAASLGMWAFLVSEIMFFGGLFGAYVIYRTRYPQAFAEASHHLDVTLGGINTAVLIGSSLSMALAVRCAQLGRRRGTVANLLLTLALGGAFVGIKVVEWSHKFHDHLVPGAAFRFEGPHAQQAEIFYSLYFAMTGLHAFHMVVGFGLLGVVTWLVARGRVTRDNPNLVEMTGLYWHFVDLVWIFLFPLLYLIGRHG
jgi:cytochrome c oxidase subunit 3